MELLSVGIARSVWLFDMNELNPAGKSIFPDALIWFGEKYSFQSYPKSIAETDDAQKAFIFKTGTFQAGQDAIVVNLSLYNDGIVAESWASTEKTDAFLGEVLHTAAVRYGLVYTPEMVRTKQYVSEVTIRLDYSLSRLNPQFASFSEELTTIFRKHNLPHFEPTGILFGQDSSGTSYKPPSFVIERKAGVPFNANRFWSKSPFTTTEHLNMLREFEKLLTG